MVTVVEVVVTVVEVEVITVVEVEVVVDVVVVVEVGRPGIMVVVEVETRVIALISAVSVLFPISLIVVFCADCEDIVMLVGDGLALHPANEYPCGGIEYMI